MTWIDDREFEPVVREAMQARPQPRSISNLAHRAMELARQQASALARRQLEGLVRLRRRTMWLGVISAVMIAVVIWAGAVKLTDAGTASNLTFTTATSSDQGSDSTSSTSSTLSPALVITAELLVVAMILLSVSIPAPPTQSP